MIDTGGSQEGCLLDRLLPVCQHWTDLPRMRTSYKYFIFAIDQIELRYAARRDLPLINNCAGSALVSDDWNTAESNIWMDLEMVCCCCGVVCLNLELLDSLKLTKQQVPSLQAFNGLLMFRRLYGHNSFGAGAAGMRRGKKKSFCSTKPIFLFCAYLFFTSIL